MTRLVRVLGALAVVAITWVAPGYEHRASADTWACVVVDQIDRAVCLSDPFPESLPPLP